MLKWERANHTNRYILPLNYAGNMNQHDSRMPRIGEASAVTRILSRHSNTQLPEDFADYAIEHLRNGFGFRSRSELCHFMGGIVETFRSADQLQQALTAAQTAINSGLKSPLADQYKEIVEGLQRALDRPASPDSKR